MSKHIVAVVIALSSSACGLPDDGIFTAHAGAGVGGSSWGGGPGGALSTGSGDPTLVGSGGDPGAGGGAAGAGSTMTTAASAGGAGGAEDAGSPVSSSSVGPATSCLDACEAPGIGTCKGETCVIDCSLPAAPAACAAEIICPAGIACEVWPYQLAPKGIDCTFSRSCWIGCNVGCNTAPIRCAGESCFVGCSSFDTCLAPIMCQADQCDIVCETMSSCGGFVSCSGATCSIDCQAVGSCSGGTCCTAGTCVLTGTQSVCP